MKKVHKICNTCAHFGYRMPVHNIDGGLEELALIMVGRCSKDQKWFTVASVACKLYRKAPEFLTKNRKIGAKK